MNVMSRDPARSKPWTVRGSRTDAISPENPPAIVLKIPGHEVPPRIRCDEMMRLNALRRSRWSAFGTVVLR